MSELIRNEAPSRNSPVGFEGALRACELDIHSLTDLLAKLLATHSYRAQDIVERLVDGDLENVAEHLGQLWCRSSDEFVEDEDLRKPSAGAGKHPTNFRFNDGPYDFSECSDFG